jgi:hypothetical protein
MLGSVSHDKVWKQRKDVTSGGSVYDQVLRVEEWPGFYIIG